MSGIFQSPSFLLGIGMAALGYIYKDQMIAKLSSSTYLLVGADFFVGMGLGCLYHWFVKRGFTY